MDPSDVQRAVDADGAAASALGLGVENAVVVHNSNRVVVRLTPCDVLARVRPLVQQGADDLEVEVARRLADTGSPVAQLAPGVAPNQDGHMLPAAEVCQHHPGASPDLIGQCHLLIWAMITTWRWQPDDQFPHGRYWRIEGLNQIRATLDSPGPDVLGGHT